MTNTDKLKQLIESKGMKMKFVADYLGLSAYGLSQKITNKTEFKVSEVDALCTLLGVTSLEEKEEIFFAKKMT